MALPTENSEEPILALLAATGEPLTLAGSMKHILRILKYFQPDRPRIIWALVLLGFSTLANLIKPWPLALIVDQVLGNQPWPDWAPLGLADWGKSYQIVLASGALLCLHLSQGTLAAAQNYILIQTGLRGLARVRVDLFEHLQKLSPRFFQGTQAGDLIYRVSWDTYAFQTFFQQGLCSGLVALVAMALMLGIMWWLNLVLSIAVFCFMIVFWRAMKPFAARMNRMSLAAHEADSRVTTFIQQILAALPLVQSFTREREEAERFTKRVSEARTKRGSQHGCEVLFLAVIAILYGVALTTITGLGAFQVERNQLTIGELLVFLTYLGQLYDPLSQLSHLGATLSDAGARTRRVFEMLDTPVELKDSPHARSVVSQRTSPSIDSPESRTGRNQNEALVVQGNLSFEHVNFGYSANRPVLVDLTFSVLAGERLAIIGPSGAGKTTLLQLLPRFYDPSGGVIRLENVDIKEVRIKELRAQISIVFQEPILLPSTLAENIAYGKPNASLDEIELSARAAHAHEFIRQLPRQYETLVGEGAARLSSGEKQRINLARAFLKNAPILLLDEPASALDPESEEMVVSSLHELMRRRTTLMISHRPSTIRHASKIMVLEHGYITAFDRPADLTGRSAYFDRFSAEVRR